MADVQLKLRIEALLREKFCGGLDRVHVLDGYYENVHVWVASPDFRGAPHYIRQQQVWDVLEAGLPPKDLVLVSLIMTFDIDEPEYQWALRERDLGAAAK